MMELGSSSAAELTVSLAPITRDKSVSGEVVVKFIHLHYNIVWHTSFSKQYIELSRHSASDWVDTKPNFLSLLPEESDHLGNGVLSLGNSKTISRDDDNVSCVSDGLDSCVNI